MYKTWKGEVLFSWVLDDVGHEILVWWTYFITLTTYLAWEFYAVQSWLYFESLNELYHV